MHELTVNRWRKFGKDRLYVNLPDGTRVGWLDLQTGETTLEREDLREEFEAALAAHQPPTADAPPGPPPPPPAPPAAPVAPVADPEPFAVRIDWRDLGVNEAGRAVHEQATAAREAAPVRTTLARILGVHTDERAWRIGAKGERKVADQLDKLPDGWHVLHSLPVGQRGADIDHLVIGPGGVFTINTKHHPDARIWVGGDTFLVNGHKQRYVRNARFEAERASRLLMKVVGAGVTVTGVIAVVGATGGFTVKTPPDDILVVTRKQLSHSLVTRPATLAAPEVTRLFAAARRSDTWTSSPG